MEVLKKIGNFILNTIQTILLIASAFLVLYIFVVQPHQVDGSSMYPTFQDKEWLLSNLLAIRTNDYKRGDVVVFHSPVEPEKIYIKRLIALPGETISIIEGDVYINDELLDESSFLPAEVKTYGGAFLHDDESVIVPVGSIFVMGDNRPGSSDSRAWGFLKKEKLIGKSMVRVLPVNKFKLINNPLGK